MKGCSKSWKRRVLLQFCHPAIKRWEIWWRANASEVVSDGLIPYWNGDQNVCLLAAASSSDPK